MWRSKIVVLVMVSGCAFSSKLTTSGRGSSGGGGTSSSGGGDSGASTTVVVPDLYGLTMEQAAARMRELGFSRKPEESSQNYACDMDRRKHYDVGQICYQHPAPGQQTGSRLPISVQIQKDYDDHGNIGFSGEWRKMPDVVGKSVQDARTILAKAKMPLDEHFELLDGSCDAGTICEDSYPRPGMRKVLVRKGRLFVGKAAAPPPAKPPESESDGGFF